MSDLLAILSQGAASLSAHRAAAATASHNLQNASTPGYARQRAVLEATLPADRYGRAWIGRGAALHGVTQARDRFLEAQLPAQLGNAARSSAQSSALAAVSALDPEAAGGLSEALSAFYAALRAAAQNPSDAGLRQSAVAGARTLALTFQRARAGVEDARGAADARLAASMQEVNGLAEQVAALNGQIRQAGIGAAPNDLLDARQRAVDRLAELTGAAPVATSEGDVSLFLPGGAALVSNLSASRLSTVADPAAGGHLALRLAGPGGSALAFTGMGGELGGTLDARDGALRAAVAGLDGLAFELAGAVNAVHQAGFGLDGTTGDALFDAGASVDGAAARIGVTAALLADPRRLAAAGAATGPASAAPGDAANLQRLVDTERSALPGGLDPFAALSKVTSDFGAAARSIASIAQHDQGMLDNLTSLRESASGVSIDEEIVELQKAQRAFEAVTRVIQAANDMYDTLLKLK